MFNTKHASALRSRLTEQTAAHLASNTQQPTEHATRTPSNRPSSFSHATFCTYNVHAPLGWMPCYSDLYSLFTRQQQVFHILHGHMPWVQCIFALVLPTWKYLLHRHTRTYHSFSATRALFQ